MANGNQVPPVPAGQHTLINEALLNEGFRKLLLDPAANRAQISQELDRMKIHFDTADEKEKALDVIAGIDWSQFKTLEDLLGRSKLTPLMN